MGTATTLYGLASQVLVCTIAAAGLAVVGRRHPRPWTRWWVATFALAAIGLLGAMVYYERGVRWIVAPYGVLVMSASSALILGLLLYIESPGWFRRSLPILGMLVGIWSILAFMLEPRDAFTLEAILQALLSGAAGAILAGAGGMLVGRWFVVTGVLAQMTSHLFYLSTNISGLDAAAFIPYGLLIDTGAELAIGIGLVMTALGHENLRLRRKLREALRVQEQLNRISELDALTGTCTRQALRNWFEAWDEARPVSVLVLDVDGLGRINERHGREAGDEALSLLGTILKEASGDGDLVVRWDDDEFLAVMQDTDDSSSIRQTARLMRLLDESLADFPYPTPLRVSWGVASCHSREEIPAAISHAEHQMRAMKDRRRRESGPA